MNVSKMVRAAIGVVVIIALGFTVMNMWNEYKSAAATTKKATATTTTSPSTTPTVTVSGVGVTKIAGVNFRVKPASSAKLIRGLKKGEKVTVLLKEGTWYKVKDSKGKIGWVTANGDYVVVTEQ